MKRIESISHIIKISYILYIECLTDPSQTFSDEIVNSELNQFGGISTKTLSILRPWRCLRPISLVGTILNIYSMRLLRTAGKGRRDKAMQNQQMNFYRAAKIIGNANIRSKKHIHFHIHHNHVYT